MRLLVLETKDALLTSAYEEAFISCIKEGKTEQGVWLWKRPKGIYLTRNSSILYIDTEYGKRIGYPPTRSEFFSVTPNSSVIFGSEWGIITCLEKERSVIKNYKDMQDILYMDLWRYIIKDYPVSLDASGNDLVVSGTDRKMFGMAYAEDEKYIMGNCMFTVDEFRDFDFDYAYRNLPSNKLEGKNIKSVSERVTNLKRETGLELGKEIIEEKIVEYLRGEGFEVEVVDSLSEEEEVKLELVRKKHLSEEWIKYGEHRQKPDFN